MMTAQHDTKSIIRISSLPAFCSAALGLISLLLCPVAQAEPVAIVVNPGNPIITMTIEEVKRYYSDILVTWPSGESVKLFDLPMNSPARKVFSLKVLGKRPEDVTMEWANKRITNTAKNPPRTLKSPVLMSSKVGSKSGALGYMPLGKVKKEKVKVVLTIE